MLTICSHDQHANCIKILALLPLLLLLVLVHVLVRILVCILLHILVLVLLLVLLLKTKKCYIVTFKICFGIDATIRTSQEVEWSHICVFVCCIF